MKRLRWLITIPLALILIVFAVNNRHLVEVNLWPLGFVVQWPLFVFVYVGVIAGFLAGGLIAWASSGLRHRRARHRQSDKESQAAATHRKDDSESSEGAGTTSTAVID